MQISLKIEIYLSNPKSKRDIQKVTIELRRVRSSLGSALGRRGTGSTTADELPPPAPAALPPASSGGSALGRITGGGWMSRLTNQQPAQPPPSPASGSTGSKGGKAQTGQRIRWSRQQPAQPAPPQKPEPRSQPRGGTTSGTGEAASPPHDWFSPQGARLSSPQGDEFWAQHSTSPTS